ncbi:MAG: translation elongation factor Ts [Bradymonadales bacterium]|jgi:elongation factor Ts
MVAITAQMVKELRERSGAGMMDCKKALVESEGDMKKAAEYLQVKGLAAAAKRAGRATKEGCIGNYLHHDHKTAVLVEINCETDFVARTDDFRAFAKNIAMHICAASPLVVSSDEVDPALIAEQKSVFEKQAAESGKPADIAEKMAVGRLQKWLKEVSLLDQPMFDDDSKTVEQYRAEISSKTGENVRISRFCRMSISDAVEESQEESAP